jgi:hypothetical protein
VLTSYKTAPHNRYQPHPAVLTSCKTALHNRYQPHPAESAQYTKCSNRAFVLLKMGIIMPETC